jgi:hypothetical protein
VPTGVLTGDLMLQLLFDDFWPAIHLAPYFFTGLGGILFDSGGEEYSVSEVLYRDQLSRRPAQFSNSG